MRDYGKVYTAFWTSEDVVSMSEDARTIALYLLTCPHGNMLGCFRLPNAYAAEDLRWPIERVSKGFAELFAKGYAYRCDRSFWIVISRYLKWNQFENPNVGKAAGKLFETITPPYEVKALLVNALREFSPTFPVRILATFESLPKPFRNTSVLSPETVVGAVAVTGTGAKPEPKPEPEQTLVERRGASPDRDVVAEIFAYWQKIMDSPRSVLDAKRKALIKAALKNYEPRQICEAILGCSRSGHHMGDNDRNTKYNGLSLILRNSEYIEKFIELASKKVVGTETLEQKNARIIAEFMADSQVDDDPNVIEMEES